MSFGVDDYPAQWRNVPQDSVGDGRGYWNRECTSFAAHRAARDLGHELRNFHNASSWPSVAQAAHLLIDHRPLPRDIVVFPPGVNGAGKYGHVGAVLRVSGADMVIEDYNWHDDGTYLQHSAPWGGCLFIRLGGTALLNAQEKIALVMLAFGVIRPQAPANYTTEILPWAAQITDDGLNAHHIVGTILGSPEGVETQRIMAGVRKGGGGGAVAPHNHTVTGTTSEA